MMKPIDCVTDAEIAHAERVLDMVDASVKRHEFDLSHGLITSLTDHFVLETAVRSSFSAAWRARFKAVRSKLDGL